LPLSGDYKYTRATFLDLMAAFRCFSGNMHLNTDHQKGPQACSAGNMSSLP
jgi:hypothetical protein